MKSKLLILFIFAVSGCANLGGVKLITRNNAVKNCKYFNVPVKELTPMEEPFQIKYVGKNIDRYCNGYAGCTDYFNKIIYLIEKDWWMESHERCHEYSYVKDKPVRKKHVSLSAIMKDR